MSFHHSRLILTSSHHSGVIPSFSSHSDIIPAFSCHSIIPDSFQPYPIILVSFHHLKVIPISFHHSNLIPIILMPFHHSKLILMSFQSHPIILMSFCHSELILMSFRVIWNWNLMVSEIFWKSIIRSSFLAGMTLEWDISHFGVIPRWNDLEWLWSSSHRNDRDGLGMIGLGQEWRDVESLPRGHSSFHPCHSCPIPSFLHHSKMQEQWGWPWNDGGMTPVRGPKLTTFPL